MNSTVRWSVSGPEFESFVNRHCHQLSVVHFWADWNPLDPAMFEVFDEIHQAVGTDVALARVQVGPPENRELCQWLGILEVPTVMYVHRNRVVDVRVGFSKNRLIGHVQSLLQRCLSSHSEEFGKLPDMNEDQTRANLGLASPSFGTPVVNSAGKSRWSDGTIANGMSVEPQRHFGLEVAPPSLTPPPKDVQQKSWLSRWLNLE
ncbi:MAG: thioredoxin family protein [Planctomycetaceae bacterium]|nr:thioredoxin family protein [Planctomycetaceae bacterium]